jgi:predicted outer membrane protein
MTGRNLARVLGLVAVALTAASCASTPDGTAQPAPGPTAPDPGSNDANGASGPAAAPTTGNAAASYAVPTSETLATFTASEVIAILAVASADLIAQARFAQLRAANPEVKAFAYGLITDHTPALARLYDLLPVTAAPDPTSAWLQRQDQLAELDLQTQQGGLEFELAYMTTQVATHARMIALLDRSLLPSVAKDRPTWAMVLGVRALYVRRLVEALDIQQRVLRSEMTAGNPGTGVVGGQPGSTLRITPHK